MHLIPLEHGQHDLSVDAKHSNLLAIASSRVETSVVVVEVLKAESVLTVDLSHLESQLSRSLVDSIVIILDKLSTEHHLAMHYMEHHVYRLVLSVDVLPVGILLSADLSVVQERQDLLTGEVLQEFELSEVVIGLLVVGGQDTL